MRELCSFVASNKEVSLYVSYCRDSFKMHQIFLLIYMLMFTWPLNTEGNLLLSKHQRSHILFICETVK